jgi:hypothetical protein
MSINRKGIAIQVFRLGASLALVLLGAGTLAGVAEADPANPNTLTFEAVCDGQPLTLTVMLAAHPPSANGAAAHVVGSTSVGVLMGLSLLDLTSGETTVILSKPIAEREALATCSYTWPLLPPFLVFTAEVLFTPRS